MFVTYDESILSHVASVRNYFGLSSSYPPDRRLSGLLEEKKPEKIFLLLIDGMGLKQIQRKLDVDAFLNRNLFASTVSVFPPTTTAATTSIRNGKAPNENGWLGWCQYLKEIDDIIIPFRSRGFYNGAEYEEGIFGKCVPVNATENELKRIGIGAGILFPSFAEDGCEDFDEMCMRLIDLSYSGEYRYVYAYWDKYDTYMHEHGPSSKICDSYLEHINYEIEHLAKNLKEDTLLIVTADHGQVDIKRFYNLWNSPFEPYFARRPSLEQRAMAFSIVKGKEKEFEKRFKEAFEDDYVLLSKSQVLESKLFGVRGDHPRFEEFIGDYIAIAKSDMVLIYREGGDYFYKGQHAGMCDDEMMIPLIVCQNE